MQHLRRNGFRVLDLQYELGGKARHRGPRRAFERSRLGIVFQGPEAVASSHRVELTAEILLEREQIEPRLENWELTSDDRTLARFATADQRP